MARWYISDVPVLGDPVGVTVRAGVLALPLHQDDLPLDALLLPAHQDASHTQVGLQGIGEGRLYFQGFIILSPFVWSQRQQTYFFLYTGLIKKSD